MADEVLAGPGIYFIRNLASGRVYIGSSKFVAKRLLQHRRALDRGEHHSPAMQRSWRKHGAVAFEFGVLEATAEPDLLQREQFWIDALNAADPRTGFNACPVAGRTTGFKESAAQIAAKAERVRAYFADHPEARERMREVGRRNGAATKGRLIGPEERAARSAVRKGSPTFRASAAATLSNLTPEQRAYGQAKAAIGRKERPLRQNRRLTFDQAEQIRARKAAGAIYDVLEREFGIDRCNLHRIVKRKTYVHP